MSTLTYIYIYIYIYISFLYLYKCKLVFSPDDLHARCVVYRGSNRTAGQWILANYRWLPACRGSCDSCLPVRPPGGAGRVRQSTSCGLRVTDSRLFRLWCHWFLFFSAVSVVVAVLAAVLVGWLVGWFVSFFVCFFAYCLVGVFLASPQWVGKWSV